MRTYMLSELDLWLSEISDFSICVSDDLNEEANENLWTFCFSIERLNEITSGELSDFINSSVELYRDKLHHIGGVFYCWHDEMASQLRFSAVSSRHDTLPFRCDFEIVEDLGLVLNNMFSDKTSITLQIWAVQL